MTCVELYQKVSKGIQSHCLEVNEGTGCRGCPYYGQGAYDYIVGVSLALANKEIGEENDRSCYKKLKDDEKDLEQILEIMDVIHGWTKK